VAGENEGGEAGLGHLDAQFLAQFADQGRLGSFAGLDLAAGEFPQTGQLLALGPFGDQHPAVHVDQGDGDDKHGGKDGGRDGFGHALALHRSHFAVARPRPAIFRHTVWRGGACGLGRDSGKAVGTGAPAGPLASAHSTRFHQSMGSTFSDILSSPEIQAFASGFPVMVLHLIATFVLLAAGAVIYGLLTPWKEIALIREGNSAASVAFGGVLLGLAIPLAVSPQRLDLAQGHRPVGRSPPWCCSCWPSGSSMRS
jgi:hypothetical protein